MKTRAAGLTVSFGIVALLAFALWVQMRDSAVAPGQISAFQIRMAEWDERLKKEGASRVYAAFLDEGRAIGYMKAHELAHIIGELLYVRMGSEGVSICTDDFAFGCYHGFAGKHMAEHGLGSVGELQEICAQTGNRIGCEHGIGHAILAFLGDGELMRALEACPEESEWFGGCTGGVFMEYNYHTMQSVSGIDPREYHEGDPYAPCDTVSEIYANACYYELPSWWRITLDEAARDVPSEEYPVLGLRCASLSEQYRDICYRGIGNMIGPVSEYDPVAMKEWCEMLPANGRSTCYEGALIHLLQSEAGREQLRALCASGAVRDENLCPQSSGKASR